MRQGCGPSNPYCTMVCLASVATIGEGSERFGMGQILMKTIADGYGSSGYSGRDGTAASGCNPRPASREAGEM